MQQEKSCGCIVLNEKNQVLLIHHNAGHWDFPKGHVEKGETEVQTAIREVKEETNIDVEVNDKYRYTVEYSPKEDVIKEVVYFLAKNISDDKEAQLEEVSEVQWFNFDEAFDKITYNTSKEILEKLKEDLKENKKC